MNTTWLEKKNSDSLIIFFNGWGMDEHSVSHLKNDEYDILMFNDYRDFDDKLTKDDIAYISGHKKIYLIAWSMGVWVAYKSISSSHFSSLNFDKLIAFNGTLLPIDNNYGIPEKGYILTEKGIKSKGMDKFVMRMFNNNNYRKLFKQYLPQRSLDEQIAELVDIRETYTKTPAINYFNEINNILWNEVYISKDDMIFPYNNQVRFWDKYNKSNYQNDKFKRIELQTEGHYPFFFFKSWKNIIEDGNSKD